ncbi:EF-hand domain-containing protein, partial [Streptomyces zhihengii]
MRTEAAERAELVFSLFDANGNGVLDSEDFDLMTGRVLDVAVDSDDGAREALRVSFRRWWT